MPISFTVNGTRRQVDVPADTPLLYVLRNDLEIGSPQFGCGLSQCGACSVLVDGKEVRSCVLAVRSVADKQVTTIEGLPARWASQKGLAGRRRREDAAPGAAGLDRRAGADVRLLPARHDDQGHRTARSTPSPTVAQIKTAFMSGSSPHLCRCGTYSAIVEAVQHAATLMAKGK